MKDLIRVGIMQPKPYPSFDDPRNLGHALMLLERCRGEKLDVVCFPEYFPYQGEKELGIAARQLNTYLVAGLMEADGDRRYNTATLFDRSGRMFGRQRKGNLRVMEREQLGMSAGDGVFRAFTTDFGKIGMPVGIDFWGQPEAGRQLADQGVDIVFNPAIFPILHGHWKQGALVRALDNFLPVVGVNTANYNAVIDGRRIHQQGGQSFVIQLPRILDREDFRRWIRSLDSVQDWVRIELDLLEQMQFVEVDLRTARRFRREFQSHFGMRR